MANVTKPTVINEEPSLTEFIVKVMIDGIAPQMFNKKQPSNGDLQVTFTNVGFSLAASLKGKEGSYKLNIKKLPSEIDKSKASWKVKKNMVVISLVKQEEVSWAPMIREGLDQDHEDSDDEQGGDH